jgi:hypothetical protein
MVNSFSYKSLCRPVADVSYLPQSSLFKSVQHCLYTCGAAGTAVILGSVPAQIGPCQAFRGRIATQSHVPSTPAEVVRSLGRNFLRTDPSPKKRELPYPTPHVSTPSCPTVSGSSIHTRLYIQGSNLATCHRNTPTMSWLSPQYVHGVYIPTALLLIGVTITKRDLLPYAVVFAAIIGGWKVYSGGKTCSFTATHD